MRTGRAFALMFTGILAACVDAGGQRLDGNPYAPALRGRGGDVDGLLVGHRLMAAGEYELALKAYHRAAAEKGVTIDVLSAIGSVNLHLGRLGQAEQMLRRAIEVDGSFVPALNNLGVVLMERGKTGEAVEIFKRAFALDSGESAEIRENLRLALARMENPGYHEPDNNFALMRRGEGVYELLTQL